MDDIRLGERTFPGTPDGYRDAWALVEDTWTQTLERTAPLPEDLLNRRVDGEWSFLETLRHLVFAVDAWVRRPVLGEPDAFWPAGVPHDEAVTEDGLDPRDWGIDPAARPTRDDVLAAFTGRLGIVRDVVAGLGNGDLERVCAQNPAPGHPGRTDFPVGECLEVAVTEAWAHHGYAVRDLALLERPSAG